MSDEPRQTAPRPILNAIAAQLFVANIKSSCDFYTNKLGFAVEFIYGDPFYYGQVSRQCTTQLEVGLRTCVRGGCSQTRTAAVRFHHR